MILEEFVESGVRVIFAYMPVWEMFFSMHVIAGPEHHLERERWLRNLEEEQGELTGRIRELGVLTDGWNLVIDSDFWPRMRLMEIPEVLSCLRKMNIIQWNGMVKPQNRVMSAAERDDVIHITERYYRELYQREEMILRPFLARQIREEAQKCRSMGLWNWCRGIHTRLKVRENELVYLKNRDFTYPKNEITTVYATVSTFLSPHLWMYERQGEMDMIKTVAVERKDDRIPEDYLRVFKALGDETRLRMIREMLRGTRTTRELAQKLSVTEAAVSKHLKILAEADLAGKQRRGKYMEYYIDKEAIEFIPYQFYELML